jgi:two-component system sensor histidine kinase NreB
MTAVAHAKGRWVPGTGVRPKPAASDVFVRNRSRLLLRLATETGRRRVAEGALRTKSRVNLKLLESSRRQQEQLRGIVRHILHLQEEERRSLSRELHEEVTQGLAGINLQLAGLRAHSRISSQGLAFRIARTQKLLAKSVRVVRALALRFRPAFLEEIGLEAALRGLLRNRPAGSRTRLVLSCPSTLGKMSPETGAVLYRAAQEALDNVGRPVTQRVIEFRIQRLGDSIVMEVEDSGRSFDPGRLSGPRAGRSLGILCMRERVAMAGGILELEAGARTGTVARVTVPTAGPGRGAS